MKPINHKILINVMDEKTDDSIIIGRTSKTCKAEIKALSIETESDFMDLSVGSVIILAKDCNIMPIYVDGIKLGIINDNQVLAVI